MHLELSPLRSLADLMKTKLIRQQRLSPFLSTSVGLTNSDCRTSFNISCLWLVLTTKSLFFVTNRMRCIAYGRLAVLYPTEIAHQRTWSNWKSHCSTSRGNSDYTRSDKMPNIFNLTSIQSTVSPWVDYFPIQTTYFSLPNVLLEAQLWFLPLESKPNRRLK